MGQTKTVIKIISTNWINIVAIFIAVYVAVVIDEILRGELSPIGILLGTLVGVLGYGMLFWGGFVLAITILDILLFSFHRHPRYTNYKLAAEWLLISSPFIHWFIEYDQWIFLVAILAFLVGQSFRRSHILRLLNS